MNHHSQHDPPDADDVGLMVAARAWGEEDGTRYIEFCVPLLDVTYQLKIGLLTDHYLLRMQAEAILSLAVEMPLLIGTAVEGITEDILKQQEGEQ